MKLSHRNAASSTATATATGATTTTNNNPTTRSSTNSPTRRKGGGGGGAPVEGVIVPVHNNKKSLLCRWCSSSSRLGICSSSNGGMATTSNTTNNSSSNSSSSSNSIFRICDKWNVFLSVVLFGFCLEMWITFTQTLMVPPTLSAVVTSPDLSTSNRNPPGYSNTGEIVLHNNDHDDVNLAPRKASGSTRTSIKPRVVSLVSPGEEEDIKSNSSWMSPPTRRSYFSLSTWRRRIFSSNASSSSSSSNRTIRRTSTTKSATRRTVTPLSSSVLLSSATNHNNNHGDKNDYYEYEKQYYETCVPMKEWQTQSYPTCNQVHEVEMKLTNHFITTTTNNQDHNDGDDTMSLISTQGSWRTVWQYNHTIPPPKTTTPLAHTNHTNNQNHNNNIEMIVLKLLKFEKRRFNQESYEYHRIDALAMERLTKSKHIINIYGYCGQTVMTEYATGNARQFVKDPKFKSIDRLKLGYDISRAFVDIHSIDFDNATNPTLAHNDINMANVVEVNGRIVLNDFNIAVLMRWNNHSNNKTKSNNNNKAIQPVDGSGKEVAGGVGVSGGGQPCGYPVRFESKLWKSPEENANTSYVDPAMADMYGLGNILFQIMTKHQPWTHLEPNGPLNKDEVAKLKMNGTSIPYIPTKYAMSKKTALQALHYATISCFQFDPHDRLTSYQLSNKLNIIYQLIKHGYYMPREDIQLLFQKRKSGTPTRTSTTTTT